MLRILSTVCLLVVLCSSIEAKKSRATQNFHCNEELNKQIKTEFDASHIYLSLVSIPQKTLNPEKLWLYPPSLMPLIWVGQPLFARPRCLGRIRQNDGEELEGRDCPWRKAHWLRHQAWWNCANPFSVRKSITDTWQTQQFLLFELLTIRHHWKITNGQIRKTFSVKLFLC